MKVKSQPDALTMAESYLEGKILMINQKIKTLEAQNRAHKAALSDVKQANKKRKSI